MNRSISLAVIALVGGCLASAAAAEKVEWKKADGGNGHSYEVVAVPEGISFVDAQLAAEKKGGHLATIASKEENEFVFKLADDAKYWGSDGYNGYGPWLGGYQDGEATETAKGWKWITDEPWEYENWNRGEGEPNDSDGNEDHGEDYLHFFCLGSTDREVDWNDSANEAPVVGYVIEWTPKEELPVKESGSKPAGPGQESTESTDSSETSDPTGSSDAG